MTVAHSNYRFAGGSRPFFKVWAAESVSQTQNKWKTAVAYWGGWKVLHAGALFDKDELDWIHVGLEAFPKTPDDEVYMTSGTVFDYNTYSNTAFGELWD